MLVLQQMIVLFIIMFIGFIAYKKDIINDNACKKISSLVVNIANPAMIISSVIGDTSSIKGQDLFITLMIVIVVFATLLLCAYFLPKLLQIEKNNIGIYRAMTTFSNIGFMGLPVISSSLGNAALIYATFFLIPYNTLIYTYGIVNMRNVKVKEKIHLKRIFNIGVIFCIFAISIFILKSVLLNSLNKTLIMPLWIEKTIVMLSNLTAPLSMMVIGASFATISIKTLFFDRKLLVFSVIKLLVIPIIGTMILRVYITNEMLIGVAMFMLCMPVGSMTAMLTQEYNGNYELASKGVAITTAMSVITIPIVSALFL